MNKLQRTIAVLKIKLVIFLYLRRNQLGGRSKKTLTKAISKGIIKECKRQLLTLDEIKDKVRIEYD